MHSPAVPSGTPSTTGTGGAAISLRCVNPWSGGFGAAMTRLPAVPFRQQRVRLSADVQTADATSLAFGVSLWRGDTVAGGAARAASFHSNIRTRSGLLT